MTIVWVVMIKLQLSQNMKNFEMQDFERVLAKAKT